MKAILEMEVPESCTECKICTIIYREKYDKTGFYRDYHCRLVYADVGMFKGSRGRCPDCPLKIVEESSHD
jgi:hypothetical protein